jgi:hypothetical protein
VLWFVVNEEDWVTGEVDGVLGGLGRGVVGGGNKK